MYHHHSQQGSQPFPNGPRPPHRHPPPNQHQNRPASDMSHVMGFQFPRPTQLPDELESALAIRGARDMDHRIIDHMSQSNQHQNQSSGSGLGQHGNYSSSPAPLTSDNQPGHQQGVDWSSYQPPTELFASPPSSGSHQPQRHQGPPHQPPSSHTGTSNPAWTGPVSDSPSSHAQHPHGVGGGGDGQGLYTPESAGSILASFGLSNEDLEVLSHYPDEQLTPDTLPFILRDIQINKSGNQKTMASTPGPSFSRTVHDMPLPRSRSPPLERSQSPEVPSLLTVTQTAGKVIDYGHASRSKDETHNRETFKREQLSSERTIKMYPSPSSSSSAPKANKTERRHGHLEHAESSKHGDQDYRRMSREHRKSNRSPGREFPPPSKSRNLDRDYRHDVAKPRPSPEARSEASSRRSLSSSSGSKSHSSSKKLPTPSMISDFLAAIPKVYPHTCSLCHIPCDHKKDWVDHINTVNHTAACRDLRNKYPDWKPHRPSRRSQQYGRLRLWHLTHHARSISCSPSPSPPPSKQRVGPHHHRPHGRSYSPNDQPRYQDFTGGPSRSGVKRPHDDSTKLSSNTIRHPSSSKVGHSFKHGPFQSSAKTVKSVTKSGSKNAKTAGAKAPDISAKPPPAKKKKKIATPTSQDSFCADRLVYLTGIPNDALEQEVTDMVRSFGKINNVILMPCSEEESEKGVGQKASVCMLTAGHAQALANSTNLSIRGQQIIASVAKKPESGQFSDANNSRPSPRQDKAGEDSAQHFSLPQLLTAGGEAEVKTSDEKGVVLVTGLPESGWSESDIIKLVQSFGSPCDVILAKQIGKVLVSMSDIETAQEMVKVNSFIPMKINDCELKMIHVKQNIGFTTPVALYNLLMVSVDPLESSVPVGWSSLVVISNVPNTATGSSEVQKLVQRFGTVIKTLVLNSVVICEMATAAMALSVYKRFQRFPCIIHNNPLIFSRKPDPKPSIQAKVITAYLDLSEDTPANGKGSKTAAAEDEEQTAHKKNAKSSLEEMEKTSDGKDDTCCPCNPDLDKLKKMGGWMDGKDEEMKNTEKTIGEVEALGQNRREDEDKKDGLSAVSDSSAAPHAQPKAVLDTDLRETIKNVMETPQEKRDVSASKAGNDKTPAGEETKASHSHDKAASPETAIPEFPKVTQEMVNALLVECRTRTASHPNNTAASPAGECKETQMETDQGEKTVGETEEPAKKDKDEEEIKKQDRERKQARERERRAKKEREREDRARRERERREQERRQWERRERERKREYGKGFSGPRSTHRLEGHKQSYWRDDKFKAKRKMVQEEEEMDEFPFNMSDFVTVDEVGDVMDLPRSPSPSFPMETTEEDALTSVRKDAPGDTPMEVSTETIMSDTTALLVKSNEHQSENEAVATDETSETVVSSGLILTAAASPAPVSQPDSYPSQTPETTCQPEAPETEAFPTPATGADDDSNSPARRALTAEDGEEEKEEKDITHSQSKEEQVVVVVTGNIEEHEKKQDEEDKETGAPAVETEKQERSEEQSRAEEEEKVKNKIEVETPTITDHSLPPFDPSNPVGMEFLVPKTGFLCKACNRFFTGSKEAEISHCKTLKHYDCLQKYLRSRNVVNATTAANSS